MRYVIKQFNSSYALMASATAPTWSAVVAFVDRMMSCSEWGDTVEIMLEGTRSFMGGFLHPYGMCKNETPGEVLAFFTEHADWLSHLDEGEKLVLVCDVFDCWTLCVTDVTLTH